MICKKCATGTMAGPRYVKEAFHQESLGYTCRTCGYVLLLPTADSKEPSDVSSSLRELAKMPR